MGYPALAHQHSVTSYFCDPHSPWQKGAIENTNDRLGAAYAQHRYRCCITWILAKHFITGASLISKESTHRRHSAISSHC